MTQRRRLGCSLGQVGAIVAGLWMLVVLQQHSVVQQQHPPEPPWTSTTTTTARRKDVSTVQNRTTIRPTAESRITTTTATFNGIPVTYHAHPPPASRVQCTGSHWMLQSCRFETLCFDLEHQDFVIVVGDNTANASAVALGGINPRWDQGPADLGSEQIKWFPRRVMTVNKGYFALPADIVWVPFHSMAGDNVGHLFWDDFYPIFRLLRQWNLLSLQLLLLRQKLTTPLYATCDIRRKKRLQCKHNFEQFLFAMGVDAATFSTSRTVRWNNVSTRRPDNSNLVCARTGVAGMGLLTDHGMADHGWEAAVPEERVPHNLGHGRDLYAFRQHILNHVLLAGQQPPKQKRRRRIVFSVESSKDWDRRLNFTRHQAALQQANLLSVDVETHRLWELSMKQQLQLALTTDIFVTVCGGGSMTATFLPRGASLLVFYNPTGGYDYAQGVRNHQPARLDWDLLNHGASHLRVHWLPIIFAEDEDKDGLHVELFVELVRHELEVMDSL